MAVSTGNNNFRLICFSDGKMITMKVPYPTRFYAKGLDGRIDDPNAGWKGRGLWTSSGDRVPWHQEGGKGMTPMVVHFQMRSSPPRGLRLRNHVMVPHSPSKTGVNLLPLPPAIHVFISLRAVKTWMPGIKPGMTT